MRTGQWTGRWNERLFWLAVGAFATSTMAFVFAGLLPLIAAATGVTMAEAGRLVTVYALSYAIGTPVLATLAGAADRRRVLVAALLLFLAGVAAAGTSRSFLGLGLAQVAMGAAAGLFAATAQATAVTLAGIEHRARAVSAVVGGTTFAVAVGAPVGALVGTLFGWRATFVFVGLLAALCAWPCGSACRAGCRAFGSGSASDCRRSPARGCFPRSRRPSSTSPAPSSSLATWPRSPSRRPASRRRRCR